MGGNELEVLEHYNRKIQKYGDLDNTEVLLKCLGKLDQVRVNILLLQQTGIGRTVSALKKKYGDSEIGSKSRDLVNKWKELVAKEEEEEDEEVPAVPEEPSAVVETEDPPTYVPTPIAPAYIPTPIDKLKETEENNVNSDLENTSEGEVKRQAELSDDHHHKSKKKKSHRDSDREETGKSSRSDSDKHKEKSHKHHSSDKSRDSKHSDSRVSKDKDNCDKNKERNGEKGRDEKSHSHKSSKSSSKDKSSESSSRSDKKHSDKDKHRTKDNEVRIKEEKEESDSKYRSKKEVSNGDVKSESGIIKVKTEPGISVSSFDFMKGDSDKSSKEKKDKKDRDKRKDESSKSSSHHKKSSSSKSNGVEDMFSKALSGGVEESSKKKRTLEDYRDSEDISKHKKSRRESEVKSSSRPSSPPSTSYKITPSSLIPDISPMYKPLPRQPIISAPEKKSVTAEDDEASLAILLQNKNKNRSAIFSGTKRKGFFGEVPSLFSQCIQVLKDHVDEIDEVGNLTYDILEPVLKQASPTTLMHIEDCNPYLMEDTSGLWRKFVEKTFRNKEREEMESWREMWERCHEEREEKLNMLKGRVKQSYKTEDEKHMKTKMAYVDIAPKAPRIVRNAQAKHGTALPVGHSMVAGAPRPRNQMGDPTARAVRDGASAASKRPKTAPMMQKTMKLMRSLKGGFRR